jgi:hypothetical protein
VTSRRKNDRDGSRGKQNIDDEFTGFWIVARRNRADVPNDGTGLVEIGRQNEQQPSFAIFFTNPANHFVVEIPRNHCPERCVVCQGIAGESAE